MRIGAHTGQAVCRCLSLTKAPTRMRLSALSSWYASQLAERCRHHGVAVRLAFSSPDLAPPPVPAWDESSAPCDNKLCDRNVGLPGAQNQTPFQSEK